MIRIANSKIRNENENLKPLYKNDGTLVENFPQTTQGANELDGRSIPLTQYENKN